MPDVMSNGKMGVYVGREIVCAEPMSERAFIEGEKNLPCPVDIIPDRSGYLVVYSDGHRGWSPKDVFEATYRLVSDDERKMM